MIETVIFDLSEVCIQGLYGVEEVIAKATNSHDRQVMKHLNGEKLIQLFEGKISEDDYWSKVIQEGSYDLSIPYFKRVVRNNFVKMPGNAIDVVKALKENGNKVYLLSDHSIEWVDYIHKVHSFMDLFDEKYYSFDLAFTKQNPKAFELTMQSLDANPETTLFVDDSQDNLISAKKAGIIHTHLYQFPGKLERDLTNYGLL